MVGEICLIDGMDDALMGITTSNGTKVGVYNEDILVRLYEDNQE